MLHARQVLKSGFRAMSAFIGLWAEQSEDA